MRPITVSHVKGQQLYQRAKRRIPGGTQLLSKRPEMFLPSFWPSYYSRARGVEVTDLDGQTFVDMSIMGVGASVLGYGDPDVDEAVKSAVDNGVMCTLNAPEEVELAELLCRLHPWAGMVRYARTGGEAVCIAVRLARAFTRRDKVAICGYHGWSDWYLAANLGGKDGLEAQLMPGLQPLGVPSGLRGTTLPFRYNRIEELKQIVDRSRSDLAAIVMEPQRGQAPLPGFLEEVRQIADDTGAVLVFDEITTGFRMTTGGLHLLLGVDPDLAVFAKAMANGYAMAAVIGRTEVMEAAQSTFISSTNWTERIGPVAALATIRKFERLRVASHLIRIGQKVLQGWEAAGQKYDLPLQTQGLPCLPAFELCSENARTFSTLFTQLMLEKGYLAFRQFKPCWAHSDNHVEEYLRAVEEVFQLLVQTATRGDLPTLLKAPLAHRGFCRLT